VINKKLSKRMFSSWSLIVYAWLLIGSPPSSLLHPLLLLLFDSILDILNRIDASSRHSYATTISKLTPHEVVASSLHVALSIIMARVLA